MEEAERLCARVGVMDEGEVVCVGKKERLKEEFGNGYCLKVRFLITVIIFIIMISLVKAIKRKNLSILFAYKSILKIK